MKKANLSFNQLLSAPQLAASLGLAVKDVYQVLYMSQHGAQINHDISYIADTVELHSHSFYEILFVCQGRNVQYLLNNNRYQLQRGDIMMILPGMSHRPMFLGELTEPYERFALWVDPAYFEAQRQLFPELGFALEQCHLADSGMLRSNESTYSGLRAGFNMLWLEQQDQHYGWQAAVSLGAISLMMQISRTFYNRNAIVAQTETRNLFDEAFIYIDDHLAEKLTLAHVANKLHVSESTISHLFQKQLDVSFYHCVVQRRLISAKNKILQGVALRDIWEACGFADYSSFYRLFKKENGMSPKEFRAINLHVSQ